MLGINMTNVESASNYPKPKAGGYVCQIVAVINNVAKKRIEVEFDIYEGEHRNYYRETFEKFKFWGGKFSKSYNEKALPFMRQFIEAVQESNADTTGLVIGDFEDIDETRLVNKFIGMAIGEKEYIGNDGVRKTKLDTYNAQFYTVDDIRQGNYVVPEFKTLEDETTPTGQANDVVDLSAPAAANFGPVNDSDIPF